MSKTLKRGIYFICLLVAALCIADFIYVKFFFKEDVLEADAKLLFDLDSLQQTCDVIYFAESSNATYSPKDTCPNSISELIGRELPDIRMGTIQHGAYHAKLFLDLVKNIEEGSTVKTIIVTMNLRSFGAYWIHSWLETPLMKADVMYKKYPPICRRMMLAFGEFDNKTEKERAPEVGWQWKHDKLNVHPGFKYQNTYDWDGQTGILEKYTLPDGTRDEKTIQVTCNYIKALGFTIDTLTNPRIKDFDEIVKIAKEKKLNLVFNLMAENVQHADSLVGDELVYLMRQNRDLLMKRYNKQGVLVVDNLELVNGNNFIEFDVISEHYDQVGRKAIAVHVAKVAGKYLTVHRSY
ncbi:MAG: hypothetical protein M3R17_00135 [Bacteroidota bacterium]|nr:hypothetical protein [Bacteroidota bacterium]